MERLIYNFEKTLLHNNPLWNYDTSSEFFNDGALLNILSYYNEKSELYFFSTMADSTLD